MRLCFKHDGISIDKPNRAGSLHKLPAHMGGPLYFM